MLSSRFYQNPCFVSDAVSLATSLLYSIIAKIIKNDTFEDFRDSESVILLIRLLDIPAF